MKKRYLGILPVLLVATFVVWRLIQFVEIDVTQTGEEMLSFVDVELSDEEADRLDRDFIPGIEFVTSLTGLWAIRFLLAAFLMSPISLVVGKSFPLYFRQSIGISTGFFTTLHVLVFVLSEGVLEIFTRPELIFGFIAFLIIISLTLTSSKRAMKLMKRKWKSLHRWVYFAVLLVMIHLIILDQSWLLYGILFGLGFVFRIKPLKRRIKALKS
ncbi:ferric reductase-like transmembrane domain-containing protein [Ancylomarina sp. DW003]|nr:ferric reductase-like transmembrane domain-containing protein [Ancylomarina sp. DW003]MDE5424262.1 ferric reductase-like transmembrane domain-containing protein [Ancylomarina sp. DW003]